MNVRDIMMKTIKKDVDGIHRISRWKKRIWKVGTLCSLKNIISKKDLCRKEMYYFYYLETYSMA